MEGGAESSAQNTVVGRVKSLKSDLQQKSDFLAWFEMGWEVCLGGSVRGGVRVVRFGGVEGDWEDRLGKECGSKIRSLVSFLFGAWRGELEGLGCWIEGGRERGAECFVE